MKKLLLLFILLAFKPAFSQTLTKEQELEQIRRENEQITAEENKAFETARAERAKARDAERARRDTLEASEASTDIYSGPDSAFFVKQYGTPEEYRQQEAYKRLSSHGNRVVLAGSKVYWLNDLYAYIQKRGYYEKNTVPGTSSVKSAFVEKVAAGSAPKKIDVSTTTVANDRIKSVTITGSRQAMFDLYLFYWGSTTFKEQDISGKSNVVQNFMSDKIIWNWNNGNPVITVVKQ